ncbi:MAG: hypothetical protein K8I27_01630 [Planctomycetes bacterium]|nr:hypothetical protein [Planctomycetota bacterium]
MNKTVWCLATVLALALIAAPILVEAQRGGGKGKGKGGAPNGGNGNSKWGKNAGKQSFPSLKIEDVKPDGAFEVVNLLPTAKEQPRIGVTEDKAYRLVSYEPSTRVLKFAVVDLITGLVKANDVKLPTDAPDLPDNPRMSFDGGANAVVSDQAATLFVDPFKGKVKVAAGYDSAVARASAKPATEKKDWRNREKSGALAAEAYRVHGGPAGRYALSVLVKYDKDAKKYTGSGATLHFADEKSVNLSWDHAQYGVPPRDRDAVCAVTDNEIIVLVVRPRTPGGFNAAHELTCLVFDRKGNLKEAQTSPKSWSGNNANRFCIEPAGVFFVAHSEDTLYSHIHTRGTWEVGYKCDYFDACYGFAPEGGIGVFAENKSPQRAAVKGIKLATGEALWETSITHAEATGDGDDEPFTSVAPGASVIAAQWGIFQGVTSDTPTWLYKAQAVDFEPICMSYDNDGKMVAVLALDRVFVLDAKSREEIHSIPFEAALPANTLGEFVAFDSKGKKLMACARGKGVWLIDLATNTIEKSLPAIDGTWARPMPDFSGVVFSQGKDKGGNVMLQKLEGGEPERIYRCEYKDAMAVCYWINDKGDEFLIAEREIGEGRLFLVNAKGDVEIAYNVAEADPMYVGDTAVTGFVTKRKQAVLISEINKWSYTGINCTVIGPGSEGEAIETSFSAVFKSEELPGRSTYGATAASPFFGGLFAGDERNCKFACPAGALDVDIGKGTITLYAWSREPRGLAAISPKGKEFFVAGSAGLTTYKMK